MNSTDYESEIRQLKREIDRHVLENQALQETNKALSIRLNEIQKGELANDDFHPANVARVRTVIDSAQDIIYVIGTNEEIQYTNQAGVHFFGQPAESLRGVTLRHLLPPDLYNELLRTLNQVLTYGQPRFTESALVISGEKTWLSTWLVPLRDNEGKITSLVGISRDVSVWKQSEEEIQYLRAFESLIATLSTDFASIASEQVDSTINKALHTIGDFTVVDHSYVFLRSPDGQTMVNTHEWCADGIEPKIDTFKDLLSDTTSWWMRQLSRFQNINIPRLDDLPPEANTEKEILRARGILSLLVVPLIYDDNLIGFLGFDSVRQEKTWIEGNVALLKIAGETIAHAIKRRQYEDKLTRQHKDLEKIVQERTAELRDSLKHLEQTNQQLRIAGKARSRFLTTMSHELRTPLTAILCFVELLDGLFYGPLNDQQHTFVRHIDRSANHLLSLIDDLLNVATIDAGSIRLNMETISISRVLSSTSAVMEQQFKRKRLNFRQYMAADLPPVKADSERLHQILLNLLSNAIIKTPEGGQVDLNVEKVNEDFVRICVVDSGPSIEKASLQGIITEFHKGDRLQNDQSGETGIGFALTRHLVNLHGGQISAASDPSIGNTFCFTMPFSKSGESEKAESGTEESVDIPQDKKEFRIFVVEDND